MLAYLDSHHRPRKRVSPNGWFIDTVKKSGMPPTVKDLFLLLAYRIEERLNGRVIGTAKNPAR